MECAPKDACHEGAAANGGCCETSGVVGADLCRMRVAGTGSSVSPYQRLRVCFSVDHAPIGRLIIVISLCVCCILVMSARIELAASPEDAATKGRGRGCSSIG